jgi:hypothetical protein
MSEFQTPSSQDQFNMPMPPAHLLSAEKWTPPLRPERLDSQVLDESNPTFIIDTSVSTNIDTSTIGMEGKSPKGWTSEVTGIIGIGVGEVEGEPKYKIPIVKETVNGNDIFSIIGTGINGKPKVVHTFSYGQPVHIGRSPEENVDRKRSETSVSLEDLGLNPQDRSVSRDHLTVTWTGNDIVVTDHSVNNTKVEAIEKRNPSPVKQVGAALTSLSGGTVENVPVTKLIDSADVPKSDEEAKQMRLAEEARIQQQKVEANASKIAELKERMDFIRDQVGPEESQLLWNYGSYDSQARELDQKGQTGAAQDLYRFADKELAKMKPQTAAFKKEYWSIMTRKHELEFPK